MKFSTTFTLATLALLSVGTTQASFCPEKAPKQDSSCAGVLSANMSSGNCEWHTTSTNSKGATMTKNDYCTCSNNHNYPNPNPNPNQRPTWDCSGDMESSTTIPPVPAPTTPAPAPAPPAPTKPVTCDPQNPVNPDFDCTQKVGPGSKCQSQILGDKWVYQCTKLASHHQRSAGRRFLQTPEEEAPTAMPILSGVSTPTEAPTEMPILSGVGTPTEMPILPGVTTPTETPTHHHHSSSAAALSSTKTIQQYHIAVVATLAASSIVVALVL